MTTWRRWLGRARIEWLATLPLLWAAALAWWTDWRPVGENALMSLRARDVLTEHHPWLGTSSSGSLTAGTAVNHPGPLAFDLFALPVRVLGSAAGLVIGALLLHGAAVLVAGHAARRVGGERLAVLTTMAFLALEWTLGPNLVLDPWNPHLVLLPFLAFLTCAAAAAAGWATALPWMVAFGAFVLQTHVSYVVLVPTITLIAAGAAWWCQRGGPVPRRPWIAAAVVGLVCWAQPLWQQFVGPGEGNLGQLLHSGQRGDRVGLGLAMRLTAEVLVVPPAWSRPSFERTISDLPLIDADGASLPAPSWLVGAAVATSALLVLLGVLVALTVWSRRHRVTVVTVWLVTAIVAVVGAIVTVAIVPAGGYGIAPHQLRWLWPIAVWWMTAVAYAATAIVPAFSAVGRRRPWVPWVIGGVAVAATMPPYHVPVGVARAPGSMASVAALVDQLDGVHIPPAQFEFSGMWIGEPYSVPVIEALLAQGEPISVAPDAAAQFGAGRVAGPDVRAVVRLRFGSDALACDAGQVLALVGPVDQPEPGIDTVALLLVDPDQPTQGCD